MSRSDLTTQDLTVTGLSYFTTGNYRQGKTIVVDPAYGSDTDGLRERFPFATLEAALAVAVSGDLVMLAPGTFTVAAGITIPTGVTLKGASSNSSIVQKTGVTADTTLLTMGESSRIEDVTLNLTSSGHYTLKGVLFGGTTTETARMRRCIVTVDNSGAGAGTSNVYGVHFTATSTPLDTIAAIRSCQFTVKSADAGAKRCFIYDTAAGSVVLVDVRAGMVRTGAAAGTWYTAETNFAGCVLFIESGSLHANATANDSNISQTLGTMKLGYVNLHQKTTNGKAFTSFVKPNTFIFSEDGGFTVGTRYMMPHGNSSGTEIGIAIDSRCVIKSLRANALVGPGAERTDTITVRKNSGGGFAATALTTSLTGAATTNNDATNAVTFQAGDVLSIEVVVSAGSTMSDLIVQVEAY